MYAAVYTYTPEVNNVVSELILQVFSTTVRTSGVGLCSMLAKTAGILAPISTGWFLSFSMELPLWSNFGLMVLGAAAMALLPLETKGIILD